MGIHDKREVFRSWSSLPAAILFMAVFVSHGVTTHAQSQTRTTMHSPRKSALLVSNILCLQRAKESARTKANQNSGMAGPVRLLPPPPKAAQGACSDLDELSCGNMELVAQAAHEFCANDYSELLCSTIANGCAQSDEGLKRLGEILYPFASPTRVRELLKELSKSCRAPAPSRAPRLGGDGQTQFRCDVLFESLKQAEGLVRDLGKIVRDIWSIYVNRKCNPCAASLGGVNIYDICMFHDPPLVQLECECKSDPALPYACFNRSGRTCCKNQKECILPDDDTALPSCAEASPEVVAAPVGE